METHTKYMQIALKEARKGMGWVNPNPMVGAVIVKDDKIIAKSYHKRFGDSHAEINAINAANKNLDNATLYITLEPCCHQGKTPPCTDAIIQTGINRVVIATLDLNPLVTGKGVKKLQEKGIEVINGVMKEEAIEQNKFFYKYIRTSIPYVTLKTAMTLDGKIATQTGNSRWISNESSRKQGHKMRHENMAIMVGVNTVMKDNPQLICRLNGNIKQPIRIVTDSKGKAPIDSFVFDTSIAPSMVATTRHISMKKKIELTTKGVEVMILPEEKNRINLSTLIAELGKQEIDSILLEGGGTMNYEALKAGIVDEIVCFIAPKIIGGKYAKTPVEGKGIKKMADALLLEDMNVKMIDNDIMVTAKVKKT